MTKKNKKTLSLGPNKVKHEWFYWKSDKFRCCKKCGTIENQKNTDAATCPGQVRVTLRKAL